MSKERVVKAELVSFTGFQSVEEYRDMTARAVERLEKMAESGELERLKIVEQDGDLPGMRIDAKAADPTRILTLNELLKD